MSRGAEGRKSFGNYSALGKMIYVRVLGMGGGGGGGGAGNWGRRKLWSRVKLY